MSEKNKRDIKFIEVIPSEEKDNVRFTISGDDKTVVSFVKSNEFSKKSKEIEISLRDENVQEILTSVPHWMIRWGNIIFLIIVAVILFLSWFIKHPVVVKGKIEIEELKRNEVYIGEVISKNPEFEKVKKGQEAHIYFLAYPEYENGIVLGVVDTIFWDKISKKYISKIKLSNQLMTTQGLKINPDTNLEGFVEILVEDKRLIENIFKVK